MKYQKRPEIIDAIQFNGTNHDAIADFCNPQLIKVGGNFTLIIPTMEGDGTIYEGDWVIKRENEELRVYHPSTFENEYELADNADL